MSFSSVAALLARLRQTVRQRVRRLTTFPVPELPYTWYLRGQRMARSLGYKVIKLSYFLSSFEVIKLSFIVYEVIKL